MLSQHNKMDSGSIVLVTGGYDHSIKFWFPHDGVCYRTAQHPESVSTIALDKSKIKVLNIPISCVCTASEQDRDYS